MATPCIAIAGRRPNRSPYDRGVAPGKRHSPEERRTAVARAFGPNGDAAQVARDVGVHPATLYRWAKQSPSSYDQPTVATAARLVETTQDLLRIRDYGEITVEEVARTAGVGLRTAFHHFASKRDLFHAATDNAATQLITEMQRRYASATWPEQSQQQLRVFLRVAAEAIYATPAAHVLFRDLGVPRKDGFAQRWHQAFERALAELLACLAEGGALAADVDVEACAVTITSAMRGIHASVFEGVDPDQAIRLVDRLWLIVASE